MGNNGSGTIGYIPQMLSPTQITRNTELPALPELPPEYSYGGEWMDPQWKQNLNSYKKLFKGYPVQMASILAVTIALAVGLALLSKGCGGSGSAKPGKGDANDGTVGGNPAVSETVGGEVDPDALLGADCAVSGNIGEYGFTINGYKLMNDYDGDPAMLVEFDFTNNSSENKPFYMVASPKAFQDGVELEATYEMTGSFDNQAIIKEVQPGGTNTVWYLFKLRNQNDPVTVEIRDLYMQHSEIVTTDLYPFEFESQPTGGDAGDSDCAKVGNAQLNILDYDYFTDNYGEQNIRIILSAINSGSATTSPERMFNYSAEQDGFELVNETGLYDEYLEAYEAEIQPNGTVSFILVFCGVDYSGGEVKLTVSDNSGSGEGVTFTCPAGYPAE